MAAGLLLANSLQCNTRRGQQQLRHTMRLRQCQLRAVGRCWLPLSKFASGVLFVQSSFKVCLRRAVRKQPAAQKPAEDSSSCAMTSDKDNASCVQRVLLATSLASDVLSANSLQRI
jgi:hypothetical protein